MPPDAIQTMATMIQDTGITVVMSAVLIYIIVRLFGIVFKFLEIFIERFKVKKVYDKEKYQNFQQQQVIDRAVYGIMNKMMTNYKPEFVRIMQYHNGGIYFNNKSIYKISCSHEVVKGGIESSISRLQNIPASMVSIVNMNMFEKEKCAIIKDLDKSKEDIAIIIKNNFNILKSYYAFAIHDESGNNVIGKVVLGTSFKKLNLTKKQIEDIKSDVSTIDSIVYSLTKNNL